VSNLSTEEINTIIIGGGQSGLSVGYHLLRRGQEFAILDASRRVGDSWRNRWDSLRLFTPARYNGLDGMPFDAPPHYFPSKNEMADYLEAYAKSFGLPVQNGVRVETVTKRNGRFIVTTSDRKFEADNVVVAMSGWQQPLVPSAATELSSDIVQLHSADYRNPEQLREGDVLVVGAGNSGAEIAIEVGRDHRTFVAGPDTGHVPFRIEGLTWKVLVPFVLRVLFHRILTTSTPIGRRVRPKKLSHGEPLIRTKPKDLSAAGIERVPRFIGARGGLPLLENDQVVDVTNVIWCTGFDGGFSWIKLPVIGDGKPNHNRGVAEDEPGLYFVGLKFLYSMSSSQIHGVGRDAARIAELIARRHPQGNRDEVRPVAIPTKSPT
jgi:putative flavoprotein involved in K+ transport